MTKPQTTTAFAGIDSNDNGADVPTWYRTAVGAPHGSGVAFPSFNEAVRDLPTASKTEVAYRDAETGEWVTDGRHVALVNPAWLGDGLHDPDAPNSAVWHIPTGSYSIVNPMDGYGPLGAVMRKYNANGGDLGTVFGQMRQYRNGGEVHMDILFDGLRVGDPNERQPPFVLGLTTGYDFFGGHALYAEVIAFDTRNGAAMRAVTDKRSRRHVGAAGTTVVAWWDTVLEQMETAADTLFEVVADARDYVVDFAEYPYDVAEFYELLGFPTYLAESAAATVGASVTRTDAWTLYSAVTEALTADFDGKDGGAAITSYIAKANDILYTPPKAESRAAEKKARALRGQQTLTQGDHDAAEALAKKAENISDSLARYTSTRKRLRNLLNEAKDAQGASA